MAGKSRFDAVQYDMFIADASFVRSKDLAPLMASSRFSLSKTPRFVPIVHEHKGYKVTIEASNQVPMATIWDQDLLIFLISQLVHARNQGEKTGPGVRFVGYDFFKFMRRNWRSGIAGSRSYELLWAGLERLNRTLISTNIKPHGQSDGGDIQFYWLPHIERMKQRNNKNIGYEVFLDHKVYEWTQDMRNVLTLDSQYFNITGGLDRFLYLWSRKSAGTGPSAEWCESFDIVREKSGSLLDRAEFNHFLRKSIRRNNLPGYGLREVLGARGPQLLVSRRNDATLLMGPKQILAERESDDGTA